MACLPRGRAAVLPLILLVALAACGGGGSEPSATLLPAAVASNPFVSGSPAPPVLPRIDPIRAEFIEAQKSTYYTVTVYVGDRKLEHLLTDPRAAFDVRLVGPACGTTELRSFGVDNNALSIYYTFIWAHPHPPCGPTTDHSETTITITVANGAGAIACTYQGAATGTSPNPCKKI